MNELNTFSSEVGDVRPTAQLVACSRAPQDLAAGKQKLGNMFGCALMSDCVLN